MSENIEYNDSVIMDILKSKVSETLGDEAWISLTQGIQVPDIHKESNCGCSNMRELMKLLGERKRYLSPSPLMNGEQEENLVACSG